MIMEYSDVGIFEVDYLYETEEGFFCIILDIHGTMGNISIDVGDYVNFSKEQTITFKE